ncbi:MULTISPECIES: hypothetical protein [Paraburkholderia]|uniref:Uncharacterized protein n=1 Tax=Paraburkholderia tropica TaxID=92647 RepID=A0A1A5XII7_9BURK|nr:hypothetical protein [Paraburkholderia tropica]MBB2979850.1 hypothetical protein [Paraburkholderia tropica]MBB3000550.1 hypothetical protein [Paraburkholderia tropica]MBB6320179.1 hypothetical protein [Paraburkholderia tropica]MDE1143675.1 hypothetical protein [Paraburkholderia tropica]OBR53316.1 hypothetical protein A6456_15020 [Paraburkholderia tropica]
MKHLAEFAWSAGHPTLVITLVFTAAYCAVGIPAHCLLGPGARDYYGTMAGVFAALAYLTLILGFRP